MEHPLLGALLPIFGLACNVFFQTAWMRLSGRASLLRSVYIGFLAGAAGVCAAQVFFGNLAANLATYAFLSYGYFHFVNLGETGRRIRLLRELYETPDGLTLGQLLSRYNTKEIVALRLARLINNGQVILENGRYRTGRPMMASIARVIVLLKKIILGRRSEFE